MQKTCPKWRDLELALTGKWQLSGTEMIQSGGQHSQGKQNILGAQRTTIAEFRNK